MRLCRTNTFAPGVRPSSGAAMSGGTEASDYSKPARCPRVAAPETGAFRGEQGRAQQGSVLIIVLWISFGLVSVALYFAHSMSMELRAADNRAAAIEAEQAIAGAVRYVTNVLGRVQEPGMIPNLTTYRSEAVPVGESTFWLIGRSDKQIQLASMDRPAFGLVDEGSKLNLNVVTLGMLEMLPRMTPELAAAIIDWRDSNDDVTQGGAESETYLRRNPPYRCKNANYESVDELRLVYGADLDLTYGEDANLNGVLDPNENDADTAVPNDNRDGRLDAGLFEYFTVCTREPQATTRTNVNNVQQAQSLVQATFSSDRAQAILQSLGNNGSGSLLEFYLRSGMSKEEFVQIEGQLIGTNTIGLVNVNTASEAVLACIPGIGTDHARTLVAYRQTNPDQLNTLAWVKDALGWSQADLAAIRQAGPWLTGRSYQFTADIAAVGHHGRGYQRVRFVLDTTDGAARICYRQDLTHLGWALGRQAREALLLAKDIR